MNKIFVLAGVTAAITLAAPAHAAATYIGNFRGLVTNGGNTASDLSGMCGCDKDIDLTGELVDIGFTISYYAATALDPSYYLGHGHVGGANFDIDSDVSDSPFFNYLQLATFTGNERAGTVSFSYSGQDDSEHQISLSYSGAKMTNGPVSGSGSGYLYLNGSFGGGLDERTNVDFKILSGNVQITGAPPVPEPATWAMMVIGFGAVGAVMRGRRKASSAYTATLV